MELVNVDVDDWSEDNSNLIPHEQLPIIVHQSAYTIADPNNQ